MASSPVGVNTGTTTFLPGDSVGTVTYPVTKIDVGSTGNSSAWTGAVTVTSGSLVGTVNQGSIHVTAGTEIVTSGSIAITAGTITTGTVDSISQLPPNVWGTVINTGTSTLGTLYPATSGSTIYITDLTVSMSALGSIAFYSGGTATVIAGTWSFNANGGIVENYRVPIHAVSGSAVLYQQVGNTATSINAQGYIK